MIDEPRPGKVMHPTFLAMDLLSIANQLENAVIAEKDKISPASYEVFRLQWERLVTIAESLNNMYAVERQERERIRRG